MPWPNENDAICIIAITSSIGLLLTNFYHFSRYTL